MSALKPDLDGTHDLGTTALRWRALHIDTITTATSAQGGSDCTVGTNLVVTGNLTVNGSTTTLNTSTLEIEDLHITVANGAADSAAANGAGIIVDGADASLLYDHTGTQWELNKPLEVTGHVLPNATATYDLGSATLGWNDLHLDSGGIINFDNGDVTATHSANLLAISGGNTRVDRLEIDSAADYIDVDTDLKLVAGADIVLDPAGGDVKVDGNLLPNADNGGALGASGTEWSDLFLHTGGVINFEAGDVTLTHSSNLLSIAGGNTRVIRLEIDSAADYIDVDTDLKLVAGADIALVPGGGDVAVTGNVVPNADDGGALGSANLNWSDLYIADEGVLNLGDDQDIKITHVVDTGLLLTTTEGDGDVELQIRDSGLKIHSSANGQLDITSDGEVEISAVTNVDIDAADVQIDASATFSIQGADDSDVTVTAEAKDLNLVVSGGGAQVLSLTSAGTGTDAIDISASAGGVDIDANGVLALDGASGINIGIAADVAIDVDSSTLDIDASGAITIDGTSTIGIGSDAAAGNISIGTNATARTVTIGNVIGASAVVVNSGTGGVALASTGAGDITIDSDDTLLLDSDGSLELNSSAGAISIGNDAIAQAINIGTGNAARTITIGHDASTKVDINALDVEVDVGADGLTVNSAGTIDVTGSGTLDIDVNALDLDVTDSSSITVTSNEAGEDLTIEQAGANDSSVIIKAEGTGVDAIKLVSSVGSIDIDSADNITIGAADVITIDTTSGDGHIAITSAHTAGDAILISANANSLSTLDIDAGVMDVDVQGTYTLDATGISLDSDASSNFTTSSGAITLDGATGVSIVGNAAEVDITTTGSLDLNSGSATLDASTLSIDSTDTTNLTMTADNGGEKVLTIDAVNSGAGAAKIVLGATNGTAIQIGHSTSEVTIGDNLTVTGDLLVSGTQTVVDTVTMTAANAISFEGATANDFETLLSIIDPTADREIKLPNQDGCLPVLAVDSNVQITATPAELNYVDVTAGTATASKALVLDGSKNIATIGTVGCGAITSTGNSGFAQITTSGRVIVDDATEASNTTDGSLQTDGGLSVVKSAVVGVDLSLLTNGSILNFGASEDVSLTHVANTGLLLNAGMQLQFRDSTEFIHSDANGYMHIEGATGVNLAVNGTDKLALIGATATFGTNIVVPDDGTIGSVGDGDAIAINASGDIAISSTTASSSGTTGSLKVSGGVGIAGRLNVAGAMNVITPSDITVANAAINTILFKVDGGNGNTTVAGDLSFGGTLISSDITSGAARTMDGTEYIYLVTTDGVTVTLPAASAVPSGQRFIIKQTASHSSGTTIARASDDKIDGGTTCVLGAAVNGVKSFVEVICDGEDYHIINSGGTTTVS